MNNIIKLDYQHYQVSFNDDGWINATEAAKKFDKKSIIYCICFTHGLMKVGRTSNIMSRLSQIASHGLLKPLISDIVMVEIKGSPAKCERLAIKRFESISDRVDKEVFKRVDKNTIERVLVDCSKEASQTKKKNKPSSSEFPKIAENSGMFAAMIHLALEKSLSLGLADKARELKFVIDNTPKGKLNDVARKMFGY